MYIKNVKNVFKDLRMTLLYLQNHYDVEEIDLGYQFVTQMGVTYFLTFISYPTVSDFLSTKIYMFNIFFLLTTTIKRF